MKAYYVPFEYEYMTQMPCIRVEASSLEEAIEKAQKLHEERNLDLICEYLKKFDNLMVYEDYDGDNAEEIKGDKAEEIS